MLKQDEECRPEPSLRLFLHQPCSRLHKRPHLVEIILVPQRLKERSGQRHDQPEEQRGQGERHPGIFQPEERHQTTHDGQQEHDKCQHQGIERRTQAEVGGIELFLMAIPGSLPGLQKCSRSHLF